MGIELVKVLFAKHASKLTASELTVMGYMCLHALDRESAIGNPPRLYFGGREALGIALGYPEFTDAAETKAKRAIRGLIRKGMIRGLVATPATGTRQVYRIRIGLDDRGSDSDPLVGVENGPPSGGQILHDRGSDSDPPRTVLGMTEDLLHDISNQSVTELQTARQARKARR